MKLSERLRERIRAKLIRWIDRETETEGCRKKALAKVAAGLKKSKSWVYSIVNRHPKPVIVDHERAVIITFPKWFAHGAKALPRPGFGIFSAAKRKVPVFSKGVEA